MAIHRAKKPGADLTDAGPNACLEAAARGGAKLAVIISCYNYAAFVERAIRSVLDQDCEDCELVVVDDGSTDGSWEVITRCEVKAFRIDNRGQLQACIFGMEQTRAPFVMFLDADDELKPGSLARLVQELDGGVAKVQFGLTVIDAEGRETGPFCSLESYRDRHRVLAEVLSRGVYKTPPTSGNVFRRDVCQLLKEVDYDRAVDGVILFAAPLFGDVVSLREELGRYRIHGRNDSGLGVVPTVASLQREIDRFIARTGHLRDVVARLAPGCELTEPRQSFYFRQRSFLLEIVSGRRPQPASVRALLAGLRAEPYSAARKCALAAFFVLGAVVPAHIVRALIAYRSQLGRRSARGLGATPR